MGGAYAPISTVGSNARAPQPKPQVYLPYPSGASFVAQSSQSNGESRRCLDWPSALPAISTTWVQGSRTMTSTTGALLSQTTMMAIPQWPCHRLCHIQISWLLPSPPLTTLLILCATTTTATTTTTPPVVEDEWGAELVALSRLAQHVDVAMCQFQSYVALPPLSSNMVGESAPPLLLDCIRREAMGANGGYRHALVGASSLTRSASAKVRA